MAVVSGMDKVGQFIKRFGKFSPPEIFLVVVLLGLGVVSALLIPIGAGFDEETHMIRVWEMSALHFVPNEIPRNKLPFPAIFWNLSYRRQVLVRVVDPGLWAEYGNAPMDSMDYIYNELVTRSVYSPPLLLPQALALRYLGRASNLPALTVYYGCRLAGLLSYILLAWLAVRLIPYGKWVLTILAISPTAIFQAATIGTDPVSNGLGLAFIGGCLALAERKNIGWKEWIGLVILFSLLFWAKVNLVFLAILPFMIIPPSKFRMARGYILLAVAAFFLFTFETVGWSLIAYPHLPNALEGADPTGQIKYIATHPFSVAWSIIYDIGKNGVSYLEGWIGRFGYNYWSIPIVTYLFYLLSLAAALLLKSTDVLPTKRTRISFLVAFVAGYLVTILSLYVSYLPVGSTEIQAIQGRYFALVMPLLFLALVGWPAKSYGGFSAWLPVIFSVLSLTSFVIGIYLSYHVPCGSKFYEPGLCYQPVYKNWAPTARYSQPISAQLTLNQEIVPKCDGMKELLVYMNASAADPDGTTEFVLRDMEMEVNLVNQFVSNRQLPQEDWFTMSFDPDWESNGKLFTLTIRSGEKSGQHGPKVSYSLNPEYTSGDLYENSMAVEYDIIFRYGCVAGLERILTSQP